MMMIFSRDCESKRRRRRGTILVQQFTSTTLLLLLLLVTTSLFSSCDSLALIAATTRAVGTARTLGFQQRRDPYRFTPPVSRLSYTAASSDGFLAAQEDNAVVPPVIAIDATEIASTTTTTTTATKTSTTAGGVDMVFNQIDMDGSGTVDFDEFHDYLSRAGYSRMEIEASFLEMMNDQNTTTTNNNGEISRADFERAIFNNVYTADDDCPRGYFLNSVQQACVPLGPIGRISQQLEMLPGPLQRTYKRIGNLFGIDTKQISNLGVSFALSYSIISNLNGAISFSAAWYISCKRTGLSPLVPGQWRNLLSSYAMIYGLIQILKPFRVAMAIAGSKLSAEWLEMTQRKFHCSRTVAIACQYLTGLVGMAICASIGVSIVSIITGVPIFGPSSL